ncbi:MAG: glycosyltransferase [Fermentimonas sp.]
MKILHVGNTAGVATALRDNERESGHISNIVINRTNPFNYPVDYSLPMSGKNIHSLKNLFKYLKLCYKVDRVHYHKPPVQSCADMALLKLLGKEIVIHYHGTDIRGKGQPWKHKILTNKVFVSTPDLLQWAPGVTWLPNCTLWHGLSKINRNDGRIIIGHAPTNRLYKGTKYFLEAMDQLKKKYPNVECLLIENKPHKEAMQLIQTCDIVVDSVGFYDKRQVGWYGVLTNEAQQMEIPCCTWIKPELEHFLQQPCGIMSVTIENITQKLEELIVDKNLRIELGKQGLKYVKKVHDNK